MISRPGRKQIKNIVTLREEKLDYMFSNGKKGALLIEMKKSTIKGHKWIKLTKKHTLANDWYNFKDISVPKDAYLIVKAMDALLSKSMDEEKV